MKSAASQLQLHLEAVLPPDEPMGNLVSLARLFWCSLSPLPVELQELRLDREAIARGFAQWCSAHRREDAGAAVLDFWDAQIRDTLKAGSVFDVDAAMRLYQDLQSRS